MNLLSNNKIKAWHITCATHNSRYSDRMFDNHVKLGEPVWLSEKEEQVITETIAEIAKKDDLSILAYNICGDHLHMVLLCTEEQLPKIIQKLKSMSARACNIAMGRTEPTTSEHSPLSALPSGQPSSKSPEETTRGVTQTHLWTQKFGRNKITSKRQLTNTLRYVQNNRLKHKLSPNEALQPFIARMIRNVDSLPEYIK